MRDTSRAGSHSQHLALRLRRSSFVLVLKLFVFIFIYNRQELLSAACLQQLAAKIIIHQQHAQMAQNIKMHIVLSIRRSNQEKQLGRLAVKAVKIHAVLHQHCCQSRSLNRTRLGMRNSNALANAGAALLLTAQHAGLIFFLICYVAAALHERNQMLQCRRLILRLSLEVNAFYLQQINYLHLP